MNTDRRIYIAGPMRGIAFYNFIEFETARMNLEAEGWTVVSPADLDLAAGFDPYDLDQDSDWNQWPKELGDKEEVIKRDLEALINCEAVCMLNGWEKSKGATAEIAVAIWSGKEIYYQKAFMEKKKNKRWRAPLNGDYYIVDHEGSVVKMREDWYIADEDGYNYGNYFQTRDDARIAAKKIGKLLRKLH
jgi:hypothetical protein